ncbi:MAG: TIGR03621 family F420-dependent LLM class oxidoreductase [Thermomicrobiales bacterium]|nr:TIGR03621 family F420-dependent LLM class oxidoreductase [Thermomicrobiales bacterium]
MSPLRPFRFGIMAHSSATRQALAATARRVEALGYHTFLLPDHLDQPLSTLPALATAAEATTQVRLGTFVLANDFRNPVLLARDAATLDILSGGRFELGLGAGWRRGEYAQAGIPYDAAPVRISRLEESLQVLAGCFAAGPFSFSGAFYTVAGLDCQPKPVQRPHPPLLVGGGGQRILTLAARQADIVSITPRARPAGSGQDSADWTNATEAATRQKLAWIHEAAGERLATLELNVMVYVVTVSDDRRAAAAQIAGRFGLTGDEVMASPHALVGSIEQMAEALRVRRAAFGISYITVPEYFMEAFAPVVAQLAGT